MNYNFFRALDKALVGFFHYNNENGRTALDEIIRGNYPYGVQKVQGTYYTDAIASKRFVR